MATKLSLWLEKRKKLGWCKKSKSVAQCVGYGNQHLRNSITGHEFCYLCVVDFYYSKQTALFGQSIKFSFCVCSCVCMCLPLLLFTFLRQSLSLDLINSPRMSPINTRITGTIFHHTQSFMWAMWIWIQVFMLAWWTLHITVPHPRPWVWFLFLLNIWFLKVWRRWYRH